MAASTTETRTWTSGGGRRIFLAFAFLLLLPFYASLGPMLFQRASRSLVGDTVTLAIFALAFSALMALILQQLMHAVRTRVALGSTSLKATVPVVAKRGPFGLFRFTTREIPFNEIVGVDTRNEVYGGTLAPILLTSTRITTKDGNSLVLGYTNTNDHEAQVPYPDIGAELAARAGLKVIDHGTVARSLQGRMLGMIATDNTPLPQARIDAINAGHTRNLRILVGALALLVIGGITVDFATASRTSFAEMGAGLQSPQKGAPAAPAKKK